MVRVRNPFKPTAGATPPLLLGRDTALTDYREAIDDGPGAPGLLTLLTGARGVGKTVMLTALGDIARSQGWVVIDETATPGMLDRIAAAADTARSELGSPDAPRVSDITVAGIGGVTRDLPPRPARSWRDRVSALLDVLQAHETGLVITVDEVHGITEPDAVALAADVQHLIRDQRAVSLVMAGLPEAVEDLLGGKVSTFLRRAERVRLHDVPVADVEASLTQTTTASGRSIATPEAARAAEATGGYPFMIQLVGYHVWRRADPTGRITTTAVTDGIDAARIRLGSLVHETALADLSGVDRTFLVAMAADDGPTRVADIAARMNRGANYVSVYRDRLLAAGMIHTPRRGYLDFALPHLRQYLREHATVEYDLDDNEG